MYKIVLFRHGESEWNKKGLFTGWTDVDLTKRGIKESVNAGLLLKKEGYDFTIAYTSLLKRSIKSLWLLLDAMNLDWIPVMKHWRLNERHYGALQGLNKKATTKKYGFEQVFKWRRSYEVRPPALKRSDERWEGRDPRYKGVKVPLTESLKDVVDRVKPYWRRVIMNSIKKGNKVLVAPHGNSLRAVIRMIDGLSNDEVSHLNIPTGVPLVYELDNKLRPVNHYYLGNQRDISKRIKEVEHQAGKT